MKGGEGLRVGLKFILNNKTQSNFYVYLLKADFDLTFSLLRGPEISSAWKLAIKILASYHFFQMIKILRCNCYTARQRRQGVQLEGDARIWLTF